MTKINTIEECLEQVKINGENLKYVHIQNMEICKAAVLTNDDPELLGLVDPELRTTALLKAVGIDNADEYNDDDFGYIDPKDYEGSTSEFYVYVEVYGKCSNPDLFQVVQKQYRRLIESSNYWDSVWMKRKSNPLGATQYKMEVFPEKSYFKMIFEFDSEDCNLLETLLDEHFENFYYDDKFLISELSLFLFADYFQEYTNNCEYFIQKPKPKGEGKGPITVEEKKWEFSTSDYEDNGREPNDTRLGWIKKRLELWLAEGTNDKTLLSRLEEELLNAEKEAVEAEKEHRNDDDDDD